MNLPLVKRSTAMLGKQKGRDQRTGAFIRPFDGAKIYP